MRFVLLWIPVIALVAAAIVVGDAARSRRRCLRLAGRPAVSLLFAAVVTVYVAVGLERLAFVSVAQAAWVGVGWALAIVAADLVTAGAVQQWQWRSVLAPYDLRSGRYWGLAVLWVAVVPALLQGTLGRL